MKYGRVPFFDRPISRIVLGSMALSLDHLERSLAVMDEFVRLGGNAIDTAHNYGPKPHGAVGEFLNLRGRETLIVMDKCCHPYGRKRVTREDLESDLLESQSRMGISKTDFLVLHRDDPDVAAGNVIEWMNEQKSLGRLEAFGASNWSTARIGEANEYAEQHGLQGFSMGNPNLALAEPQEPMWAGAVSADSNDQDWYGKNGLPLFSWSSGAGGFFAGVQSDNVRRVYFNESNLARKTRAEELAKQRGVSPIQIAVAWLLHQPLNVFAISGPRTVGEVRENMAVTEISLSPQEARWLKDGQERIDPNP